MASADREKFTIAMLLEISEKQPWRVTPQGWERIREHEVTLMEALEAGVRHRSLRHVPEALRLRARQALDGLRRLSRRWLRRP